jgi:hypothetical protein
MPEKCSAKSKRVTLKETHEPTPSVTAISGEPRADTASFAD